MGEQKEEEEVGGAEGGGRGVGEQKESSLGEPAPTGQTKAKVVLLDSDWSTQRPCEELCLLSSTSCFLLLLFSPVYSSFSPSLCRLLYLSPSSSPPTTFPSSSSPISPPPHLLLLPFPIHVFLPLLHFNCPSSSPL